MRTWQGPDLAAAPVVVDGRDAERPPPFGEKPPGHQCVSVCGCLRCLDSGFEVSPTYNATVKLKGERTPARTRMFRRVRCVFPF